MSITYIINNYKKILLNYKSNKSFTNIIDKINNIINNNIITITITNVDDRKYQLKSFINKLSIKNIKIKEYITHGSFSNVYNTSNSKKIFKIIEKRDNEIKALIFHYLLLEYYKKNNKNKIYFVDLYDFGILEEGYYIKYYSLMEKFGISLYDSLYKNLNNKKKNNNYDNNFNYLFEIFYQCCYSLKLLHDLEYLHLDIKPENFLYYNDQIKIIDFGNVYKNETTLNPIYFQTTPYYQAFDWLYEKTNSNNTIKLTYSYDIFSLGCMFVELLYIIVLNEKIYMTCPLIKEDLKLDSNQIKQKRKEYYETSMKTKTSFLGYEINNNNNLYQTMYKTLENDLKSKKISKKNIDLSINLTKKMCNPNPKKRSNNIDNIIKIIKI